MAISYLKELALNELRATVPENLECYRISGFQDVFDNLENKIRSVEGLSGVERLEGLKLPKDKKTPFDAENAELVYTALKDFTPMLARQETIWAHLSHFVCLDYVRARWPIPEDDKEAIKHIRIHYFATSARALERDQAISRLWWMGFAANRAEEMPLGEVLRLLMHRADVRANLIERPTTAISSPVFSAIIRKLKASFEGKGLLFERTHFRALMMEINRVGGVQLLESLSPKSLDESMSTIILNRLGLTEI